ncbi:uncharacterized protein [Anabrus simplex]|uniref:uncharacterized protein isoform X2 n=1 Tax=Anabrus simplex TaxID=316456 RepID=UPI0035A2BCFD
MLDLTGLEYYCFTGVWSIAVFHRDWLLNTKGRSYYKPKKSSVEHGRNKETNGAESRLLRTKSSVEVGLVTAISKNQDLQQTQNVNLGKQIQSSTFQGVPVLQNSSLQMRTGIPPVYSGRFTEYMRAEMHRSPVIVKRVHAESPVPPQSILLRELEVLRQNHHPNILLLMGVMLTDANHLVTVFEDASMGSLHHILHKQEVIMSLQQIIGLLIQLCHVMTFLHERGWLHTALTSHAILLAPNNTLKLTAFELAKNLQQENNEDPLLREQWFQWQAPEQLQESSRACKASDVFSAGLVLWEMCTNAEPWASLNREEVLKRYKQSSCALEGNEELLATLPKGFTALLQRALQVELQHRQLLFPDLLSLALDFQDTLKPMSPCGQGALKKARLLSQPRPQRASFCQVSGQQMDNTRDPYTGLKRVQNNVSKSWKHEHLQPRLACTLQGSEETVQNMRRGSLKEAKLHVNSCLLSSSQNMKQSSQRRQEVPVVLEPGDGTISTAPTSKSNFLQQEAVPVNMYTGVSTCQPGLVTDPLAQPYRPTAIKPASHQNQRIQRRGPELIPDKGQGCGEQTQQINRCKDGDICMPSLPVIRLKNSKLQRAGDIQNEHIRGYPYNPKINISEKGEHISTLKGKKLKYEEEIQGRICSLLHLPITPKYIKPHITPLGKKENGNRSYQPPIKAATRKIISRHRNGNPYRDVEWGHFPWFIQSETSNSCNEANCLQVPGANIGSTEDLYIDDEFNLGMELESHMQLLSVQDGLEFTDSFEENAHQSYLFNHIQCAREEMKRTSSKNLSEIEHSYDHQLLNQHGRQCSKLVFCDKSLNDHECVSAEEDITLEKTNDHEPENNAST